MALSKETQIHLGASDGFRYVGFVPNPGFDELEQFAEPGEGSGSTAREDGVFSIDGDAGIVGYNLEIAENLHNDDEFAEFVRLRTYGKVAINPHVHTLEELLAICSAGS